MTCSNVQRIRHVIVAPVGSPTLEEILWAMTSCTLVDRKINSLFFCQLLGYNYAQHQNNNPSVSNYRPLCQLLFWFYLLELKKYSETSWSMFQRSEHWLTCEDHTSLRVMLFSLHFVYTVLILFTLT